MSENPSASYGRYHNDLILDNRSDTDTLPLRLHPKNLENIWRTLIALRPDPDDREKKSLRQHIQAYFVRRFLLGFFDDGHEFSGADEDELTRALACQGVSMLSTSMVILEWNESTPLFANSWEPRHIISSNVLRDRRMRDDAADDFVSAHEPIRGVELPGDDDSDSGHNMLDLLYNIARKQADRHGHVHRGVECNSCGACPIQGIRYHCANCFDYDLCETCEAKEVHTKTHVFYKISIPAPSRGQIKAVTPKWYPGNDQAFPGTLPSSLMAKVKNETGLDEPDIQGLYEQFTCIAGHPHDADPAQLGTSIDRKAFDSYFIPSYIDRPTPANLIYDRIFAFYDENDDKLIDFLEFMHGINRLNNKSFTAKVRRIFKGFDLDADGYVCRKDFLRMFRAYYDLSTQLNREMLNRHDEMDLDDVIRETVQSNHPISAAFLGNNFPGHLSRGGQDKVTDSVDDYVLTSGPDGVLQEDREMKSNRHKAISMVPSEARERHPFRSFQDQPAQDDPLMHAAPNRNFELLSITNAQDADEAEMTGPDPPIHPYGWPPVMTPEPEDIVNALGADVALYDIDDPLDRARVIYQQSQRFDAEFANRRSNAQQKALNERWQRRQFYLDVEEGMTRPATYAEGDTSEDEAHGPEPETVDSSRGQSLRSRSSSKVRFDDSAIDTDYETRSNASSRSLPQNERWGGFELSRPTLDIGADVLYGAIQQGFNELIDSIFKEKEDRALEAQLTRKERARWEQLLDEYSENRDLDEEAKQLALVRADSLRTEALLNGGHEQTFDLNITGSVANIPGLPAALSQMRTEITRAIREATNISREASPRPAPPAEPAENRDPTLPQFRADDASSATTDPDPLTSRTQPTTKPPSPPPSPKTLSTWLRHRTIDIECELRGGPGRLNLIEFSRAIERANEKENEDENKSEDERDLQVLREARGLYVGGDEGMNLSNATGVDADENSTAEAAERANGVGGNDEEGGQDGQGQDGQGVKMEQWSKSGDLGKFAFLGTWLELAQF